MTEKPGGKRLTEDQIQAITIGERLPLVRPVQIVEYDPQWPRLFERVSERIQAALGRAAILVEHVGSTSVPGLAAKPLIDVLLVVTDTVEEPTYVPAVESAGYVLRIRESEWYEHRMFKGSDPDVNLHVFSSGCSEPDRMLLFRDWLRNSDTDRRLYEHVKRELVSRDWKYVQDYADAKSAVVEEIIKRAQTNGVNLD